MAVRARERISTTTLDFFGGIADKSRDKQRQGTMRRESGRTNDRRWAAREKFNEVREERGRKGKWVAYIPSKVVWTKKI